MSTKEAVDGFRRASQIVAAVPWIADSAPALSTSKVGCGRRGSQPFPRATTLCAALGVGKTKPSLEAMPPALGDRGAKYGRSRERQECEAALMKSSGDGSQRALLVVVRIPLAETRGCEGSSAAPRLALGPPHAGSNRGFVSRVCVARPVFSLQLGGECVACASESMVCRPAVQERLHSLSPRLCRGRRRRAGALLSVPGLRSLGSPVLVGSVDAVRHNPKVALASARCALPSACRGEPRKSSSVGTHRVAQGARSAPCSVPPRASLRCGGWCGASRWFV